MNMVIMLPKKHIIRDGVSIVIIINYAKTTLYELRHTFVSITKSLPEGYLKQLVGHSKDMDTYGVYSHEISSDKDTAAKMIQDIFEGLINDQ